MAAARAGERQPRQPGRDGGADGRIEPQRAPAGLACIPYRDDLLRLGDCLALELGALDLGRSPCGSTLAFLRAAVRTHAAKITGPLAEERAPWRGPAMVGGRNFGLG